MVGPHVVVWINIRRVATRVAVQHLPVFINLVDSLRNQKLLGIQLHYFTSEVYIFVEFIFTL